MATLQVRDIDDKLYKTLKFMAKQKRRSVSQEVARMIESYLATQHIQTPAAQTRAFLDLAGAWADDKSADDIIADIRSNRKNSQRFEDADGLFN